VEVPGDVYGFIWPEAPPYAVDYVPGSAFTLTFDRQLAPEQDLELFYIQQGSYVPIHPAGSRDPYFGGQPQDVYRIRGNQLRIWAASGGLPMGTAMVVLPAGLKAADGSVLKEDVSFLVSQARPSPLAQVRDLVVDHDTSEKPLLRLLSEQGGPPIGYAVRDSVAVVDQPDGRVIRVLQHMDTFVIEGDQHHGWQKVTYYTRAPEALQSSVAPPCSTPLPWPPPTPDGCGPTRSALYRSRRLRVWLSRCDFLPCSVKMRGTSSRPFRYSFLRLGRGRSVGPEGFSHRTTSRRWHSVPRRCGPGASEYVTMRRR
jgi:hypothetical protein